MSSHLGLLILLVSDVPRARAFSTDYLGLEAVPEFSSDEFVLLGSHTGGTSLALQDATKETYGVPLAHGGIIPGFEVEDADAIYQQWQAKSVEILGEVTDMGAGLPHTVSPDRGKPSLHIHRSPRPAS